MNINKNKSLKMLVLSWCCDEYDQEKKPILDSILNRISQMNIVNATKKATFTGETVFTFFIISIDEEMISSIKVDISQIEYNHVQIVLSDVKDIDNFIKAFISKTFRIPFETIKLDKYPSNTTTIIIPLTTDIDGILNPIYIQPKRNIGMDFSVFNGYDFLSSSEYTQLALKQMEGIKLIETVESNGIYGYRVKAVRQEVIDPTFITNFKNDFDRLIEGYNLKYLKVDTFEQQLFLELASMWNITINGVTDDYVYFSSPSEGYLMDYPSGLLCIRNGCIPQIAIHKEGYDIDKFRDAYSKLAKYNPRLNKYVNLISERLEHIFVNISSKKELEMFLELLEGKRERLDEHLLDFNAFTVNMSTYGSFNVYSLNNLYEIYVVNRTKDLDDNMLTNLSEMARTGQILTDWCYSYLLYENCMSMIVANETK